MSNAEETNERKKEANVRDKKSLAFLSAEKKETK
jgi:hypothetical protein